MDVVTAGLRLEIIVPFWGDPQLLYAAVDSVRAQSDPNWTMTIVDDCYPDASVAERFVGEPDPRIRYLRNPVNLGTTGNYERCRNLATGELMMFMGCDDLMRPGFVAAVLAAFRRFPTSALVQTGVEVIDETGSAVDPLTDKVKRAIRPRAVGPTALSGERLAVSLLRGDWLYWPSLVFRTEVLRRYPFRDGLPIIQDLALVIDMVAGGESLVLDPDIQFAYRRHSASVSSTSLYGGTRFADERRYYQDAARQMRALGWRRAEAAATIRWTSRLHGLALLPGALRRGQWRAVRPLVTHAISR